MPFLTVVVVVLVVLVFALAGGFVVGTLSRRWCPTCGGGLQCTACPTVQRPGGAASAGQGP